MCEVSRPVQDGIKEGVECLFPGIHDIDRIGLANLQCGRFKLIAQCFQLRFDFRWQNAVLANIFGPNQASCQDSLNRSPGLVIHHQRDAVALLLGQAGINGQSIGNLLRSGLECLRSFQRNRPKLDGLRFFGFCQLQPGKAQSFRSGLLFWIRNSGLINRNAAIPNAGNTGQALFKFVDFFP